MNLIVLFVKVVMYLLHTVDALSVKALAILTVMVPDHKVVPRVDQLVKFIPVSDSLLFLM